MPMRSGKAFHLAAKKLLGSYFSVDFIVDYPVRIGAPPKAHKFDLVSRDLDIIGECKDYTWTEGGNVPSAKIAHINEAVLYLSRTPENVSRFIVLRKAVDPKRSETLAEYYVRMNRHLLGDILLLELDLDSQRVRQIWPSTHDGN